MQAINAFLFNFAASYGGGGYKRLYEYAKWFNVHGGAWFVIHPRCGSLAIEFQNNRFVLATQPRYTRIFNDCAYLDGIKEQIGEPDFYYSYGVPIYARIGKINWFHLCNVLPLGGQGIPLTLIDRLRLGMLGRRIKDNFHNADIISAESDNSLDLIDATQREKLFLSVNGSDDELAFLQNSVAERKENIATIVGTYRYKALKDSYNVFEMLRKRDSELKLVIIGNEKTIPRDLRHGDNIEVRGVLQRSEVIECLRKTRFYISTTRIENSYNAASEGVFFADEAYISDIGPHRELLLNMPFDEVTVPNVTRPMLHVRRQDISGVNLKSWPDVIGDMMNNFCVKLRALRPKLE